LRAGRHGAGDGCARGVEDEAARCGLDAVAAAELGPELEPLGDRHALGADVAVALTALAVDAAEGPDELERRVGGAGGGGRSAVGDDELGADDEDVGGISVMPSSDII